MILIRLQDPKNNTYHCVEKQNVNCCSIKCSFCHICIHSYKCSCVDFLIRTVICKHIHYIAMQGDNINIQVCPSTSHTGNENSTEVQKLVSCISKRQDSDTLKEQIRVKALSVIEGLESGELSNEQLKLMLQHQNAVLSVSNINVNKFDVENSKISTEPANKNISKQPAFFSTKKKKLKTSNLSKSTSKEVQIIDEMLNNDIIVSCNSENDHQYF